MPVTSSATFLYYSRGFLQYKPVSLAFFLSVRPLLVFSFIFIYMCVSVCVCVCQCTCLALILSLLKLILGKDTRLSLSTWIQRCKNISSPFLCLLFSSHPSGMLKTNKWSLAFLKYPWCGSQPLIPHMALLGCFSPPLSLTGTTSQRSPEYHTALACLLPKLLEPRATAHMHLGVHNNGMRHETRQSSFHFLSSFDSHMPIVSMGRWTGSAWTLSDCRLPYAANCDVLCVRIAFTE